MPESSAPVFTIGHSSRPLDVFLGMLTKSGIACVVDVRRLPGSRNFPHYNADALADALAGHDIDYWHLSALCGRRTKRDLDGAEPEHFWRNASFARYAAYAHSDAFRRGLQALLDRAHAQRCALMCSEAVWWRCHRRIITDHLLARECEVRHIMAPGKVVPATLTQGSHVRDNTVIYPAHAPPDT